MPSNVATPDKSPSRLTIRSAEESDMVAIQRIYARHVQHGLASFEEVAPGVDDMIGRRGDVLAQGLPYLAADSDGILVGYCYASLYRSRSAYRFTCEDSVYVADGMGGHGVGRALLSALITTCEQGPWRRMIAVIGDSGNRGSIALHARLGFQPVGTLPAVGFKLGRWVDSVLMQRPIGPGDQGLPGNLSQ
ncbi:MAG: GNAT family N-acetyltransferase [Azospirillaceae bacterium]|nr:GNAT family N-acetyltransferase [Azospirillaceae bacterium]